MPQAISGRRDAARRASADSSSFKSSECLEARHPRASHRRRKTSRPRRTPIALIFLGGLSAIALGVGFGFCGKQLARVKSQFASAPPAKAETSRPENPPAQSPMQSAPAMNNQVAIKPFRLGYPEHFVRFKPRLKTEEIPIEISNVPEILFEPKPGSAAAAMLAHAQAHHGTWAQPAPHPPLLSSRDDFAGLPFRMGSDCYLYEPQAIGLQELSKRLHDYLDEAKQIGPKPPAKLRLPGNPLDADYLSARIAIDSQAIWQTSDAVRGLVQILQVESEPYRRLLVRLLSGIPGENAGEALAQRAVFDVSPAVRGDAVYALRSRPEAQYRSILLAALRYPWPTAAEFAAEAIVNLNQTSAIPDLVAMLRQPDPSAPFQVKTEDGEKVAVREVVQLNHLRNCLLCHAASTDKSDRVRGLVFDPDRQATTPTVAYYKGDSGLFARAEVTYLKQDFSLMQPVSTSGKSAKYERFDYLVRTRIVGLDEVSEKPTPRKDYPQRRAVLFALRELTGEDFGSDAAGWEKWLN